ncbi:hypothetical protein Fot_22057 [Forsythia ovata]|uniref:Uncharacterized protein n=1 Tax=Forsythia ovata TaxID=205694 RepID=A0ABD1UWL4_9LAMI
MPKIRLAGLAAKRIHPVVKKKSSDNDQKKIIAGLSLKGGEKSQDVPTVAVDLRQTTLVLTASPQGLQIMVHKRELGVKRVEKDKAKEVGSSRIIVGDDEDVEVLEDVALTRKAKKPWNASSKSPHNIFVEVRESEDNDKENESRGSEGPDCDYSAHIRKFFEGEPSDISCEVYDMIHPHLQRALATVDSFWTRGWADYSEKSSAGVKLSAVKALVAWSLVLIEEVESSVQDLELNKMSVDTTLRNVENIIKDWDRMQERATWLRGLSMSQKKK